MGTKNKPSEHDAWDKADDDEPRIAFLARDQFTEHLLRIYAAWQVGDVGKARAMFDLGSSRVGAGPYKPGKGGSHARSITAEADAVLNWRMKHRPRANTGGRLVVGRVVNSPADIIVQCESCGDKVLSLIDGLCLTCELAEQDQADADRARESHD